MDWNLLAQQPGIFEGAFGGALKGAIIGGVVGAVVGLGLWVMRLVQPPQEEKPDDSQQNKPQG